MHSLGIVQWNSTRGDHPGNPVGVFGSGLIILGPAISEWVVGMVVKGIRGKEGTETGGTGVMVAGAGGADAGAKGARA